MKLLIRKDGKFFSQEDLKQGETVIGRSQSSDLVLSHVDVSRKHIKIFWDLQSLYIEDLGSKNGSLYKKSFIEKKTKIEVGDVFHIGPFSISIEHESPQSENTVFFQEISEQEKTLAELASEDDTHLSDSRVKLPNYFLEDEENASENSIEQENNEPVSSTLSFEQAIAVKQGSEGIEDPEEPSGPITAKIYESSEDEDDESDKKNLEDKSDEDSLSKHELQSDASPKPKSLLDSFLEEGISEEPSIQNSHISLDRATEASVISGSVDSQPSIFDDIPVTTPSINDPSTSDHQKDPESDFESTPSQNVDTGGRTYVAPLTQKKEIQIQYNAPSIDWNEKSYQDKSLIDLKKSSLKKKIIFSSSSLLLGLLFLFLLEGENIKKILQKNPIVQSETSQSYRKLSAEEERILLFQIEGLQKELEDENMDKAAQRLTLLKKNFEGHPEVLDLEKKWRELDQVLARKQQEKENAEQKKLEEIKSWIDMGQRNVEQNQFDLAIANFEKALELSPNDVKIIREIKDARSLKEKNARSELAQKRNQENLTRIYKEGARKFDAGELGEAQKLLQKVAQDSGHPNQASAKKMLRDIEQLTDTKIQSQLEQAQVDMRNTESLPKAYQSLKTLKKQFPAGKEISTLLSQAEEKMLQKAKELYAEGLAQEELAADPAAALDLYQEVLQYAPEPSDRYHQKAKEKIDKLQF